MVADIRSFFVLIRCIFLLELLFVLHSRAEAAFTRSVMQPRHAGIIVFLRIGWAEDYELDLSSILAAVAMLEEPGSKTIGCDGRISGWPKSKELKRIAATEKLP